MVFIHSFIHSTVKKQCTQNTCVYCVRRRRSALVSRSNLTASVNSPLLDCGLSVHGLSSINAYCAAMLTVVYVGSTLATDRVSWEGKAIGDVRLSARWFLLYLFNRLTFERCKGHGHSSPGIESQGHRSRSKVKGQSPARMGVVTQ